MKKIGSGWQYHVYKISETRVRKVELTPMERFIKVMIQSLGNIREVTAIRERLVASLGILERVINERSRVQELIGSITFPQGTVIEQDYAIPLGAYFKNHSFEENCRMIDGYIELIQGLWRFGIADRVFSVTINTGVSNGRVILLDIGELTDSQESVAHAIATKRWEHAMDYWLGFLFRPKLRRYSRDQMNRSLTTEKLDNLWNMQNVH